MHALLKAPELLFGLVATGVLIGIIIEQMRARSQRRRWRATVRSGGAKVRFNTGMTFDKGAIKALDAVDQLRVVMSADFSIQPLLNRSEARLFKELDRAVTACNPGWRVMAQVSLGEILRSKTAEAYHCINSKRVDLLLVDENCHPRHAIEYQGGGHYQGSAAARDATKKEALRRAGVGHHEIVAGRTTPAELRQLVQKLVEHEGGAAG